MADWVFPPDSCISSNEMMFRHIFWQNSGKIPGGVELIS